MRLAPVLAPALAALATLAACDEGGADCPGDEAAELAFSGTRVPSGDPSLTGLDPDPSLPDCEAAVGHPDLLPSFPGTISFGPSAQAVTLCRAGARPMFGLRSGDRIDVETATDGAVLRDCGGCPARLRLVAAGDLLPGGAAPPAGFDGALVEILSSADGPCGACVLPCAARYAITGGVP